MNTSTPQGSPTTTQDGDPAAALPTEDQPAAEKVETEKVETEPDPESEGSDLVDEMSKQSFPTSDPPATWSGRDYSE